jgi:vancomycin resistance protein YoaR
MLRAGLQDVEHLPAGFGDQRYPAGRDAGVPWGGVDLRFRNDSPYGVLVSATTTVPTRSHPGDLTVSLWSTKIWDVTLTSGARYAVTAPATTVLRTADCRPHAGYSGFDVEVTREFHRPGSSAVDHSQTFHAHYLPSEAVVCKPPRR